MKLAILSTIISLSSLLTGLNAQQNIPFTDKRWVIQAQGQMHEGYKGMNSLYLQGGMAYIKDAGFLNGIIEFDIYLSYVTSFSGLVFRLTDPINYEELYLRAQQSSNPDAYQYTPVYNGNAAWQLYHDQYDLVNDGFISWKPRGSGMGYNGVLSFPFDRWLHVKLLVKGTQAELYLDKKETPAAFIRQLKMVNRAGGVGIKSTVGAAHFANFSFTVTDDIVFKTKDDGYKITAASNTINSWEVSNVFSEKIFEKTDQLTTEWLGKQKWKSMNTDADGMTNLSQLSAISDSTNTIMAKITVNSDKDQLKRLNIGYSDRVKLYCNGNALFSANNSFRTRDYRYLGTIGYFETAYLPLKKGNNTIILAVSETFGGWGVMAKWENMEGIR